MVISEISGVELSSSSYIVVFKSQGLKCQVLARKSFPISQGWKYFVLVSECDSSLIYQGRTFRFLLSNY